MRRTWYRPPCLVGGMVAEGSAHRHREVFDVCLPVGAQLKELHSVPLLAVCQKGSGGDQAKLTRGWERGQSVIRTAWQCFGFGIRIRIQEGKNYHESRKKIQKFHVLKYWMFSFEGSSVASTSILEA